MDLPSESREKSSQKRRKVAMHALGRRPTYVQSPKPTTETSNLRWLLCEQPKQTTQDHYCSTGAHRIPNYRPLPRENGKTLYASQWHCDRKARAEIVQHTTKPLPNSHTTCAHRSTTCTRDYLPIIVFFLTPPRCYPLRLVAQGWNVSLIGFAPAHGDAV
jgi:hypothetical protein